MNINNELQELELKLLQIDRNKRLYIVDKPVYFNSVHINSIIDSIYQTFNLKRGKGKKDGSVIQRAIITWYLLKHKHIPANTTARAMGVAATNGQNYVKLAKNLIAKDMNAKNLYETLIELYG